jgi:uncharacterized protein with PhoU and TrkA domain
MKAQELRDRLAAVRNFEVLVNGRKIEEVIIDIANSTVYVGSERIVEEPVKEEKKENPLDEVFKGFNLPKDKKKEGDK